MNPFLHSTLARRLPALPWRRPRPAASARGQAGLRHALGLALLAAGVAHAPAQALDLNDATAQQLEAIRGIGPRTAQTIVSERERAGHFESLEDLAERVRGISRKKAEALGAAGLTVGAAGPGSRSAGAPGHARAAGTVPGTPAAKAGGAAAKAAGGGQGAKPATPHPRP
ncbi:MAG: ComEA family DNA-binding protein [Achromobacter sp.]|uniref:ComEA family DNA-binding protein n=1 Tax=Achromobacter sp. TaxID=134375 RepID=UPI003D038CAC